MWDIIKEILPYFVTIVCSIIASLSSIAISRKETKGEIEKIVKQHELNLESERERYRYEIEKQEMDHKHQMELMQKEMENKFGLDLMNSLMSEILKNPEIQKQVAQGIRDNQSRGNKKK